MSQCYYRYPPDVTGKREQCPNEESDYWCSEDHKKLWQEENYPATKTRSAELQEKLKQWKK